MKRTFLIMLLALMTIVAMAVPAKRGQVRTLTLTDGTTVQATLVGDEYGHYWLASDGRTFQSTENATIFRQVDAKTIREKAQTRRNNANAKRMKKLQRQQERRKIGQFGDYTGSKKGIVILVNFKDVKFKDANNNALFNRIANEKNFSYGSFKGSIHDYFTAQSSELFDLTFDVVGPYTLSENMSYYGSNNGDNDQYPGQMVCEAVQKANADVNFKNYDWDNDGEVDQVYVIYAGKGEADGGAANTIWPHAWTLESAHWYGDGDGVQYCDGVKIDTYACGSELNGSGNISGIGTMCHEFSHCLGYPDFYDTDYSGGDGMSSWDLMDMGSYNGNGYQPAGYTGYERWMAGWQEPIELNAGTVKVEGMKGLQNGGEFYIMYNDGHPDEYYMLENRTKTGWDTSLPGSGLLVIHVDYDANVWANNQPNDNPNHQRMTWVPADNNRSSYSMANDPFPYGSHTSFDNTTTPAASLYNKNTDGTKFLNKGIYNISKNSNGNISFTFKGASNVSAPTFSPEAGTYAEELDVEINCETADATIYYTTDGSDPVVAGNVYTSPIHISTSTTLKAVAVLESDESDIVTADYVILVPTGNGDYSRVVNTNQLIEDATYFIVYEASATSGVAFAGINDAGSTHYGKKTDITIDGYTTSSTEAHPLSLVHVSDDIWYIMDGEQYLYYKGSGNSLDYTTEKDVTGTLWTIKADGISNYSYSSQNRRLQYNSSSSGLRFACYTGTQKDVVLYMKEGGLKNPGLKFSETSVTALPKQSDFTPPTLINPYDVTVTYASSNSTLAQVDENTGAVTIGSEEGTVTITASFPGDEEYRAASAAYTIVVEKKTAELWYDESEYFITISDAFTAPALNNPAKLPVTFSSSDETLAKVNAKTGAVTLGNKGGTVTIFADFEGNEEYKPASTSYVLNVERKDAELWFAEPEYKVYVSDDFTPPALTNPANLPVTFSSSDETLAKVNEKTGAVTIGNVSGTVAITATFDGNDEYKPCDTFYIIRIAKKQAELSYDEPEYFVSVGDDFPTPTLTNPYQLPVTFESSDETLAKVDEKTGAVTLGTKIGRVTITAFFEGNDSYESASANYYITISEKVIEKQEAGLAFSETMVTVQVDQTEGFTAPVLSNPHDLPVTYSSSDETLAKVDAQTGAVSFGTETGEVTITASFAGDDYYFEGSASYTIAIVPNPNIFEVEGVVFEIQEDGSVAIIDGSDASGAYTIPQTVTHEGVEYTVTAIAAGAFKDNTALTEVVIPETIASIGAEAFAGCTGLEAIYVYAEDPILLTEDGEECSVFAGVDKSTCKLYVFWPNGEKYRAAYGWSEFENIIEMETEGIDTISHWMTEGRHIYDLSGRKLNSPRLPDSQTPRLLKKGIYIVDGKKLLVK